MNKLILMLSVFVALPAAASLTELEKSVVEQQVKSGNKKILAHLTYQNMSLEKADVDLGLFYSQILNGQKQSLNDPNLKVARILCADRGDCRSLLYSKCHPRGFCFIPKGAGNRGLNSLLEIKQPTVRLRFNYD